MNDSRPVIEVPARGLKPLAARPSFGEYLSKLWQRRHFIKAEARAKAFQTSRDMKLGKAWLIISPLLESALYGAMFGLLLQTNRGIENFVGFVIIGMTFFQVLSKQLNAGIDLVIKNGNLIRSFMFPRASIVFSQGLRLFYDTIPPMLVAILFALAMQWDKPLNWTIILAIPIFLLGHLFGIGMMFIVGRLTAFQPDFQMPITIVQRAWFYASGIFFAVDQMAPNEFIRQVVIHNPGFIFLKAMRDVVMYGNVPDIKAWSMMIGWGLITFAVGMIYFWRAEARYVTV